jgi:hypothetical protein
MKNTVITIFAILTSCVALAKSGESEKYPLDWRYSRLEPGVPMLDKSVAGTKPAAPGLMGRVVTTAKLKPADVVGDTSEKTLKLSAWRNERVNGQVVVWSNDGVSQVRLSCSALIASSGSKIPASALNARFVRYVLGGDDLHPDVLDPVERIDIPAGGYRPVWLLTGECSRLRAPGISR